MPAEQLIELQKIADAVMSCAPYNCRCEKRCFELAKFVKAQLALYQPHRIEPDPDPGEITDYAPHWECPA